MSLKQVIFALFIIEVAAGSLIAFPQSRSSTTKTSHLSTGWMPKDANSLKRLLKRDSLFANKHFYNVINTQVRALVVPHAGLKYSGIAAASAFNKLMDSNYNKSYKKVIILAPSHTQRFKGIALPLYTEYKTALGTIPVHEETINKMKNQPLFQATELVHEIEHSVEIQLPALQNSLTNFSIIPLIVGHLNEPELLQVAEIIGQTIDDQTILVVTSDLTHYGQSFGYTPFSKNTAAQVKTVDSSAIESILYKNYKMFSNLMSKTSATICGEIPLKILLKIIETEKLGPLKSALGAYYNSAHILKSPSGGLKPQHLMRAMKDSDIEGSVGYSGIIFSKSENSRSSENKQLFSGYEKEAIIATARGSVLNELSSSKGKSKQNPRAFYPVITPELSKPSGAFVTIETETGELRGCIGKTFAQEPLIMVVEAMAKAAAFNDSRFKAVTSDELKNLKFSVTILSAPRSIKTYKQIELGVHGIIFEKRGHSAVFLPDVPTGQGWTLEETLTQLSLKAGLASDSWKTDASFMVFEGTKIKE